MEFLNVGPLELFFILLIAFVVLGPEGAIRHGRNLGRMINRIIRSPLWASIISTSREIRDLPHKIVQETGLEETVKEISTDMREVSRDMKNVSRDLEEQASIRLPMNDSEHLQEGQQEPPRGENRNNLGSA
jgi:Sec-independent protein translocase protein TatA